MTIAPRVLDSSHWDEWFGTLELAFGGVQEPPQERALDHALTECERELGAAYLGGISLSEASAAFLSDPAPWLPHSF
ncbi:hypothetical protein PV419_00365 [Streptomyces sp. ME19-01-6]|nr:hypothetical protein [Streptomyces sp. ME19-01-6]MDX3224211.1 hypothetical protein [Streptomyces sp. ME19-01-6]